MVCWPGLLDFILGYTSHMKKLVSLCTFVVLQVECQKGLTSSVISYTLLTKLYNKIVEQTSNIDHVYCILPMGSSL
jgi:hypothetical protein